MQRSIFSLLAKQAPKLLILLTVVSTLSAFADSAEAARRRRGNKYNRVDNNQMIIDSQFILFDTDENGNFILDSEPTDRNVGFFSGAIEDFTLGNGSLDMAGGTLDFFNAREKVDRADLKAELFTLINVTLNDGSTGSLTFVRYSILEQEHGNFLGGFAFDPDFSSDIRSPIDSNQAINNLTYILENDLLGRSFFLPEDSLPSVYPGIDIEIVAKTALKDSEVLPEVEPEPEPVPEPMTGMVLASGMGGAFMFWKRRRVAKGTATKAAS